MMKPKTKVVRGNDGPAVWDGFYSKSGGGGMKRWTFWYLLHRFCESPRIGWKRRSWAYLHVPIIISIYCRPEGYSLYEFQSKKVTLKVMLRSQSRCHNSLEWFIKMFFYMKTFLSWLSYFIAVLLLIIVLVLGNQNPLTFLPIHFHIII